VTTEQTLPGRLTTLGWCEWSRALALLTGATCAWADVDGFHVGPAPPEPPFTNHLWAWRPDRLFRLRIGPGRALMSTLDLAGGANGAGAVPVTVVKRRGVAWPPGLGPQGEQTVGELDRDYFVYEARDPSPGSKSPLVFVERDP
jgi:hypothetical protein